MESSAPHTPGEAPFAAYAGFGTLRSIRQAGPNRFAALTRIGPADVRGPYRDIICDDFRRHRDLEGVRHAHRFDVLRDRRRSRSSASARAPVRTSNRTPFRADPCRMDESC